MFSKIFKFVKSKIPGKDNLFLYLLLISSILIRVIDINYNTAFNDEGIYVVIGRMGLFTGDWWSYGAKLWMAGIPYIYPSLSALAYQLFGLVGSRLLNVFFGVFFVEEVYRFTRLIKIFDERTNKNAALISALLASVSGVGIFVSKLATYDVLSFLLLLLAINSFLKSEYFDNGKYFFLSFVLIVSAFLTKIIIAAFIPLLFIMSFVLIKNRSIKNRKYALYYFYIPLFISGIFILIFYSKDLLAYIFSHNGLGRTDSFITLFYEIWYFTKYNLILFFFTILIFIKNKKYKQLISLSLLSFVIPIFHIVTRREQTLFKHLYLETVFLSVIAGYGIAYLYSFKNIYFKYLITTLFGAIFINYYFNSRLILYELQNSWDNTKKLQEYLVRNVKTNDKILTENGGAVILSLYDITFPPKNIVTFDWIDYSNLQDENGYIQAVNDVYFDFIELDGQFSDEDSLDGLIKDQMKNNYQLVYRKDNFDVYKKTVY